jgi:ADP-ribosylglycohydrolase
MVTEQRLRLRRSLEGLALGDAFGERFFGPPGTMTARIEARELPPGPWAWTDDTAMALSVVEVLEAHGRVVQDALAGRFAERYRREPHRGYGRGAHDILTAIAEGTPWELASRRAFGGSGSLGNGGAMRVAPLGAYFADDVERLIFEARASAEVTHAHPEGQDGAVAVALAAGWAVRGEREPLLEFVAERLTPGPVQDGVHAAITLGLDAPVWHAATRLGAGERVSASDTVPFALWCAARHATDFTEAMWATVSGLGDRDTTCAIVGGIVALSAPEESLPVNWLTRREPLGAW